MPKIIKLVFTGGPCSGKTTALNYVAERLRNKGITVLTIEETATRLLKAGFAHELPVRLCEFERAILNEQLAQEERFFEIAKTLNRDIVIICDRGICDIAGYAGKKFFCQILQERGLTYIEALARYDGVFHLVTAADGAPRYYSKKTNKYRLENIEEALSNDKKVKKAWLGHSHLRVISNIEDGKPISFEKKLRKTLNIVCHKLGIPVPLEIEKKYVVKPIPDINKIPVPFQKVSLEQVYSQSPQKDVEQRIRKRGQNGVFHYYLTLKRDIKPGIRWEEESQISQKDYEKLFESRDRAISIIRKDRFCFLWKNQYFELDIFKKPKLNFALLEIELTGEQDQVILPPFLKIIKEVTEDKKYTNYELAGIKKKRNVEKTHGKK